MTLRRRARAGMTLVELMVAMAAVALISVMLVALMSSGLGLWSAAERQRKVYTRARVVFSYLEGDLQTVLTRDPPGGLVYNRLFCEPDKDGRQVLMITRTFGTGSERGLAFAAGDGLDAVDLPGSGEKPRTDDEDADPRSGRADEEIYNFKDDDGDGRIDEDLAPLAGSAQVAYLLKGRELRRALRSPAGAEFQSMFKDSSVLCRDVIHFGILFATPYSRVQYGGADARNRELGPYTTSWYADLPLLPSRKKPRGPFGVERLWDSTRGVIPGFSFYVGSESKDDGEDDVFPELVRVTLVVEPHELRTVRSDTLGYVDDTTGFIPVASTDGFPPGGRADSYVLVGEEWMHYSGKSDRSFTVDGRGARGTVAAVHQRGASVRRGYTFTRTFFLPGYRNEDATVVGKLK